MTNFLDALHLPGPEEPAGVLMWGKSPELVDQDLAAGVARIGGLRTPFYDQSYLLAANTLLRTALQAKTLDHHALPIFYLQRHAAELLIKAPLLVGLEVKKLLSKLGKLGPSNSVIADQRHDAAFKSHSLADLLSALEEMTDLLQVGEVPAALEKVVCIILSVEQSQETWSRYASSWAGPKGQKQLVMHVEKETIVPLAEIQNLLQTANVAQGSVFPFDGRMMGNLGSLWQSLAREAGEID